jgi:hypothetical protein
MDHMIKDWVSAVDSLPQATHSITGTCKVCGRSGIKVIPTKPETERQTTIKLGHLYVFVDHMNIHNDLCENSGHHPDW